MKDCKEVRFDARLTPDAGAAVIAAIGERRDRIFAEARSAGRRESTEAYAAGKKAEAVDGFVRAVCGDDYREAAERALATGQEQELEPMDALERKIVHDAVASIEGVQSGSRGEDPNRFVVVSPVD